MKLCLGHVYANINPAECINCRVEKLAVENTKLKRALEAADRLSLQTAYYLDNPQRNDKPIKLLMAYQNARLEARG